MLNLAKYAHNTPATCNFSIKKIKTKKKKKKNGVWAGSRWQPSSYPYEPPLGPRVAARPPPRVNRCRVATPSVRGWPRGYPQWPGVAARLSLEVRGCREPILRWHRPPLGVALRPPPSGSYPETPTFYFILFKNI